MTATAQSPAPVVDLTRFESPRTTDEFERLYEEFQPRVRGLVRKLVRDPEVVEDLVQETFLRAYNSGLHAEYHQAHPEHTQWPWLAAVARNLCFDVMRRRRGVVEHGLEDDEEIEFEDHGDDPELHFLASRRREGIREALQGISDRQRRVLIAKAVEGRRYDEIAEAEGISVDALKSLLARARRTFHQSYSVIAERRGLGILVGGGFLREVPARIRSIRDRISQQLNNGAAHMAAGGPAAAVNAAMTALVVGGAALVGSALGASAAEATPAPVVVEPSIEPVATITHPEPRLVEAAARAEATVDAPESEAAVTAVASASTPASATPAATEPAGVSAGINTHEVAPVENPPAGASAGVETSEEGPYKDIDTEVGVDGNGDGNSDDKMANDTDFDCSRESQQNSKTMTAACLVLDSAEDAMPPTAGL